MPDALSIAATGAAISFTGVSSNVAIPNDSSGSDPKYIRLAATSDCFVKVGQGGVTAASGDILVQPGDAIILKTGFAPYIAAIQSSAAGVLQISPLED